MTNTLTLMIALAGGFLLGFMVFFNGTAAKHLDAIPGSLLVHVMGLLASVLILIVKTQDISFLNFKKYKFDKSHCVGLFGAIAVALIGYTANSKIGVSGTVGCLILGQILYGWISDIFGLFGATKRKLVMIDYLQAILILVGVGVIIYG